jgi:hypothetical protein
MGSWLCAVRDGGTQASLQGKQAGRLAAQAALAWEAIYSSCALCRTPPLLTTRVWHLRPDPPARLSLDEFATLY